MGLHLRNIDSAQTLLKVQPYQLLVTTDDPKLGDGWNRRRMLQLTLHPSRTQAFLQDNARIIFAHDTGKMHLYTQAA